VRDSLRSIRAVLVAVAFTALAGCGQIPDQGGPSPDRRAGYLIILVACGLTFGLLALVSAFGRGDGKDDEREDRGE